MKILLVCAAGLSTSMLTKNMKKFAQEGDVVDARPASDLENIIPSYDVVLLGPQIRFRFDEITEIAGRFGKPADVIDMRTYGTMDGKAAMAQAAALLN